MSFSRLVLLGSVLGAAGGLAVAAVPVLVRRRRPGAVDVGVAVTASAVAALVQVVMVGDGFARLHVLYLWVFVSLPLMGAAFLSAAAVPALRPRRLAFVPVVGLLALAPVGVYATHVEPYRLRTERVTVEVEALEGAPAIRVGVLADLQTDRIGAYERDAVARLLAEEPDLILLPGDIFQSDGPTFNAALPEIRALLGELDAPGGVFVVEGDIDSPGRLTFMTEGLDVEWIDGEVVTTEVGGVDVHLAGIPIDYDSDRGRATLARLADLRDSGGVRIVLAHRPDVVYLVPEDDADLVVAGHTHGGQVRLPLLGPPITLSGVPRHVAAGGLHDLEGQLVYVSSGVGVVRDRAPQVRFLSRPSIGILTLVGPG